MIALTAAILYVRCLGRARLPLLGLAACLAVLTKPSALVRWRSRRGGAARPARRLRGLFAVVALVAGATVGLCKRQSSQARYLHMGLRAFLTDGTGGFYASLNAHVRSDVLLDSSWLGADLRILLVFALVYALARLIPRSTHRISVGVALASRSAGHGWGLASPARAAVLSPERATRSSRSRCSCSEHRCSSRSPPPRTRSRAGELGRYSSAWRRRLSCGRGWRSIPTGSRLRRGHHSCCS